MLLSSVTSYITAIFEFLFEPKDPERDFRNWLGNFPKALTPLFHLIFYGKPFLQMFWHSCTRFWSQWPEILAVASVPANLWNIKRFFRKFWFLTPFWKYIILDIYYFGLWGLDGKKNVKETLFWIAKNKKNEWEKKKKKIPLENPWNNVFVRSQNCIYPKAFFLVPW